jgi:hypothetical protein
MRMWMVDPRRMCRKHLLGEHVELHMLAGSLRRGRSIQGFLDGGLLEPQNLHTRHAALVKEMERRGYRHASPLPAVAPMPRGRVDRVAAASELSRRCSECRKSFVFSASFS